MAKAPKNSAFARRLGESLIARHFKKNDGTANAHKFAVNNAFSPQSVANWLKGTEPHLGDFFRLCDALEVEPRWLATGMREKARAQIDRAG